MNANLKQTLILAVKVIALTVALMVLSGIGAQMLPPVAQGGEAGSAAAGQPASPPAGSFMTVVLTVMLFQVVALAVPILRSRWSGWRLVATVFVLHFGTVTFLNQIESLVYLGGKMPAGFVPGLFAMGLFTAAVFAPIAVVTLGRWKPAAAAPDALRRPPTPASGLAWRFPVAAAVFLALYYLFGYYVAWQNPDLRDYYGGTDPGSFLAQMRGIVATSPWMLPLQFVRGLGWVALGFLVIRSMKGAWWHAALATALLFAVPCLYLLLTNPVLPDFPRMTHLVETLPYQFLFGWFLGWFFARRSSAVDRAD